MKVKLKKDIVIKAGTIFSIAPTKTERRGDGHVMAILPCGKDGFGVIEYCLDIECKKQWGRMFEVIE